MEIKQAISEIFKILQYPIVNIIVFILLLVKIIIELTRIREFLEEKEQKRLEQKEEKSNQQQRDDTSNKIGKNL